MSVHIHTHTGYQQLLYSFEDAVNAATGNLINQTTPFYQPKGDLILFENGCWTNAFNNSIVTQEVQDCALACSNGDGLWDDHVDSVYTLQNCMVYPIIVSLMQAGALDANSTQVANEFGIVATSETSTKPFPAISSCISDFCASEADTDTCDPGTKFLSKLNTSDFSLAAGPGTLNLSLGFTSTICHNIDGSMNDDLGGPGVFIAYMIQIGVIISTWLALHLMTSWAQYPAWAFLTVSRKPEPWNTAREFQRKLAFTAPEDVDEQPEGDDTKLIQKKAVLPIGHDGYQRQTLLESLSDFQLTQVFFMVSLQIAVIVLGAKSKFYEAGNWQALINDAGFVENLALDGCLSITMTLLTLRAINHEVEVYTIFSTFCCVFLAGAAWFFTGWSLIDVTDAIKPEVSIASCGNMADPTEYCLRYVWWAKNASTKRVAIAMVSYSWFVVLVLVVERITIFRYTPKSSSYGREQAHDQTGEHGRRAERINIYQLFGRWTADRKFWGRFQDWENSDSPSRVLSVLKLRNRHEVLSAIGATLILTMELVLLALMCIVLDDYSRVQGPSGKKTDAIDWADWSLSSVISVTVWLPVLTKYLYYALIGDRTHPQTRRDKQRKNSSKTAHFKLIRHSDDSC